MTEKDRFKHIEPKPRASPKTTSDTGEFFERITAQNSGELNPDTAITQPDMEVLPEEPTLAEYLTKMVGQDTEPPNPNYPPDWENPFWKRINDQKNFAKIRAAFEAVINGKKPTDRQTAVDLLWMLKLLARRDHINWNMGSSDETLFGNREEGLTIAAQGIFRGYESVVDEIINKMRVSADARE